MSTPTHGAADRRVAERRTTPNLVVYTSLWSHTLAPMLGEQEQRERFSYALREAMAYRKASARALAKDVGVDARILAKWQRGESLPNLYQSQRLAAALRVSEDLFRNPEPVPPPPPKPYYPLDRYLLEAGERGEATGRRRAHDAEGPGMRPRTRAPRLPRAASGPR